MTEPLQAGLPETGLKALIPAYYRRCQAASGVSGSRSAGLCRHAVEVNCPAGRGLKNPCHCAIVVNKLLNPMYAHD